MENLSLPIHSPISSDPFTQKQDALYRKKFKEIMFLYFALLHGWRIEMLADKTFHFSRNTI